MTDAPNREPWPSGTLALVFTDVERSTELWQIDEEACELALAEHDQVVRDCLARYGGLEVKHTGDGFFLVFKEVPTAASFCLELQEHLAAHPWPAELGPVRSRIGVHYGRARLQDNDYRGPSVNLAARICSAASGGQTLVSGHAAAQLWPVPGISDRLSPMGSYNLPGMPEPVELYELHRESQAEFDFRPLSPTAAAPAPAQPLQASFDDDDDELWMRVKVALREADNLTAIEQLSVLQERHPRDIRVLTTLGVAYAVESQYAQAERCLSAAVELAPGHAAAWFNLARVYGKMGRRERVGHALAMALRADPAHPKARAVAAKYGVEIPEL